jgi:hypothetical protein
MAEEKDENKGENKVEHRMEMLDQRLDNIDSVVTNLVERVMYQPVSVECPCPKCGSTIRILLTGNVKLVSKNQD